MLVVGQTTNNKINAMNNSSIKDIYTKYISGLNKLHLNLINKGDYDGPFIMAEPSDEFKRSKHRILVIGQETNGWIGDKRITDESGITDNMSLYSRFNFGKTYNSLFFRYARKTPQAISESDCYMWTNIFKFGKSSGRGTPHKLVNDSEIANFNVLTEELYYIKPTCVIFMTGPYYDQYAIQRIPDIKFIEINGFPIRKFAHVISQHLPIHSYRIYHPGHGNTEKIMYDNCFAHIAKNAQQGDAPEPPSAAR